MTWQPELRGFSLSDESAQLTSSEIEAISRRLDAIEAMIARRSALVADGVLGATALPSGNWDPHKPQVYQPDGDAGTFMSSFSLVMRRDPEIIGKLRLYAQAFSGYQLATLSPAVHRPWIREKLPANYDIFLSMLAGGPEEGVAKFLKVAASLPENYRISFPAKFGEIGWIYDDLILNRDTYMYLERICLMYECGLLPRLIRESQARTVRIVEIGSGFGGLAYIMKRLLPNAHFVLIDLPESLAFCHPYLSTLFPDVPHALVTVAGQAVAEESGFTYVANFDATTLDLVDVDLVINTLSFAELDVAQVLEYCNLIKTWLAPGSLFFEQNFNSSPHAKKDLFNTIGSVLSEPRELQSAIIDRLEKGTPRLWSVG
ncbi:MAG: hypothetical protein VR70_15675 [Rhodospirillaceae bacterium BRH_c57]|nr:MAG: hypothetical protein VR70_15675 [Rhodospirillaceae bacterium BRH_c57]